MQADNGCGYMVLKDLRSVVSLLLGLTVLQAAAVDLGRIRAEEVAVYVQDLNSGEVLEAHREDVALNPASAMKLVTAFAALRSLGSDYRWQTELKTAAGQRNGVLDGDIYWVGSGDPVLDQDGLTAMQQQLRDGGISRINGQLVLDGSVWNGRDSADGFSDDSGEPFMTAPDPHMLAYKVVWAVPERNESGGVAIRTNPPLPNIAFDNRVSLSGSASACGSLSRYMNAVYGKGVLSFSGSLPESCLGKEMFINMLEPKEFAQHSFINQWRAAGGSISDGLRLGRAESGAKVVARHRSKRLAEVLSDMNKFSNNLIARTVFLKMGERSADGLTAQHSEAAVRRELASAGLDDEALVLENGSGLSRRERITAKMLGQMLGKAYRSPFQTAFVDSLPIAGTDGTLKTRFKHIGPPLRLKTGTLKNVRALAGYYLDDKRPLAVVVLLNSPRAGGLLEELDALVTRIVQTYRSKP